MNLLDLFKFPILQGPMAGGGSSVALVAGVSNAGGLGCFGGSLFDPAALREQVERLRALTTQPFALNFFIQTMPTPSREELALATELLQPALQALGRESLPQPSSWCQDFNAQFETLLELRPAAASFTFGILSPDQTERLHQAGIVVIGTATTVEEVLAWQAVGADAVVASGIEAGGHRGTFLGPQEDAMLPAKQLWKACADAVTIPVIAAGGIMNGADIKAALALGARAVQMGTAFLVCDESGIHPAYKHALVHADVRPTRLTRGITGRYARGLENRFVLAMEAVQRQVPAYPVQNALTTEIRKIAGERGDTEWMSLWAGAEVGRARPMPVAQLMQTLLTEMGTT